MSFTDAVKALRHKLETVVLIDEAKRDELLTDLQNIDDQHHNDLTQAATLRNEIEKQFRQQAKP